MTGKHARQIHVLVVDDSAFMRKSLSSMLSKYPDIRVVSTARDGHDAIRKVERLNPDVMTLDIAMPAMNGLAVLEELMRIHPLPVVVVSALTEAGAYETIKALELGAVDFLPKHLDGSAFRIAQIEEALIAKVRAAAQCNVSRAIEGLDASVVRHAGERNAGGTARPPRGAGSKCDGTNAMNLVVIGCSTGGPQALRQVLPRFPADFPAGLVIAQHMPTYFTKPFAQQLNGVCAIEVREAEDGDRIAQGIAFIAPGGRHLTVMHDRMGQAYVRVSDEPRQAIYRPSVDVLMQSAASVFGRRTIGVVLTGMGNDGLAGMRAIHAKGGQLIVQDEASSLIYGMPKAVADAGLAVHTAALSDIAATILSLVPKAGSQLSWAKTTS